MKSAIIYAFIFLFLAGCFLCPASVSAHQPRLVFLQQGAVQINNPEISQAFYDNLRGAPRDYFIDSSKDFELYVNLLVPAQENGLGRYSADVFDGQGQKIYTIDGSSVNWQEFYEPFGRDYYLKGPELSQKLGAGKYKIEVYSKNNLGEYVLVVGQKEFYDIGSLLNIYWQLPLLKLTFFKTSVWQFFLTPFGIYGVGAIGAILILIFLINYFVGLIKENIKHNEAKTLLLTSAGMQPMKDEILKLLTKPAYDVTVAFITTAAKSEENLSYLNEDLRIMREEVRFNVEEIDIEGKTESQVMKLLELKDIIFVEGGNTFYLLKAMRACKFEKVIRKLLKQGKVYIGVSAGSMVAGKTIITSVWRGEFNGKNKNTVGLKNLKGLGLVPFDIFVHYQPEYAEIIKEKMPNVKKRAKNLRILTDDQAILVQGKEVDLIGEGEKIII